jgi:hypothetical protein
MAKIIKFPGGLRKQREVVKMMEISDKIDDIILTYLHKDIDVKELASILAHRLGTLLRHIDQKSELYDVCAKVTKRQAALD